LREQGTVRGYCGASLAIPAQGSGLAVLPWDNPWTGTPAPAPPRTDEVTAAEREVVKLLHAHMNAGPPEFTRDGRVGGDPPGPVILTVTLRKIDFTDIR
jgi:hypothetical protein